MNASSDKMFDRFKDLDFSDAKPVAQTPPLAKLQGQTGAKSRITMRIDSDILEVFKARAALTGGNYQTLINDALRQFTLGLTLTDVVRDVIRDTLTASLAKTPSRTSRKKAA